MTTDGSAASDDLPEKRLCRHGVAVDYEPCFRCSPVTDDPPSTVATDSVRDNLQKSECPVPLYPGGAECIEQAGHDGPHHGLSRNIQWTYTACWEATFVYGQEHRCIRPKGHVGGHANG